MAVGCEFFGWSVWDITEDEEGDVNVDGVAIAIVPIWKWLLNDKWH